MRISDWSSDVCSAAYALSRIPFRGRAAVLLTILSVSMFPQIAVLAGMFELVRGLGLYNGLAGLVLSYLILTLPFTTWRSEEHTSELQSLMRTSYAVFCLKQKNKFYKNTI